MKVFPKNKNSGDHEKKIKNFDIYPLACFFFFFSFFSFYFFFSPRQRQRLVLDWLLRQQSTKSHLPTSQPLAFVHNHFANNHLARTPLSSPQKAIRNEGSMERRRGRERERDREREAEKGWRGGDVLILGSQGTFMDAYM